jgi:hypothetical protein
MEKTSLSPHQILQRHILFVQKQIASETRRTFSVFLTSVYLDLDQLPIAS